MRRILLAALLLALAAGTADARHRRHHGFFVYQGDQGERSGQPGDRYGAQRESRGEDGDRNEVGPGQNEPAFAKRYRRGEREDRYRRSEPVDRYRRGEREDRYRRAEGDDRYGERRRRAGREDVTTGVGTVGRDRPARPGVDALVPANWQLQPPDERWTGRRFVSPDGNAWLALYSVSTERESREDHFKKVAFVDGEDLTYLRREPDWLVVSGLKGERIFYRKAVLACDGWRWRHLAMEYPADQKEALDALVVRAARTLEDGGGEDCAAPARNMTEQPPAGAAAQPSVGAGAQPPANAATEPAKAQ